MSEFRHEIAMRWADLDSLNHVNNVVYLEYAAQARAAAGIVPRVGRTLVEFRRPILLGRAPVVVTSTVDGDTVRQRIGIEGFEDDFAHVEVSTAAPTPAPAPREGVRVARLALRDTDFGASGTVSAAQTFELFQETRVSFIASILPGLVPGRFVVGRVRVDHHAAIAGPARELESREWVSRVGASSYTIEAQLGDAGGVLATAVATLVGFDVGTQRSRVLGHDERESLAAASG